MHVFDTVIDALEKNDPDLAEGLIQGTELGDSPLNEVWNKVGIIAMEQGKTGVAQICFEKSLAVNPVYANALSNLGNIMKDKGDTEEAIRLYNMAISADPDYPTAYHNLGVLYKEMGKLDKAVPLLKKSLRVSAKINVRGAKVKKSGYPNTNWRYLLLLGFLVWLIITVFRR